jgi:hypothetical protein
MAWAWTFYPCPLAALSTHPFSTVMSASINNPSPDSTIFRSVIEHVFMPPKLPQEDPGEHIEQGINVALCDNLIDAAQGFLRILPLLQYPSWMRMIKMMEFVRRTAAFPFDEANLQRTLSTMAIGGTPIWLIHPFGR